MQSFSESFTGLASATWNFSLKFSSTLVSIAWDLVSRKGTGEGQEEWGEGRQGERGTHSEKKETKVGIRSSKIS